MLRYCRRAMSLLDKLERRFGFLGIPGLMRIVVVFNALVFLLVRLSPGFHSVLDLDPGRIRHGEIWRLITYIFLPQTDSFLWVFLLLWFLWFIGEGLEQAWGAFRLTLYFVVGRIGTTAAAFFFGARFSNSMLYSSLFFAFARFYPDQVIYLFFVLPAKIKWARRKRYERSSRSEVEPLHKCAVCGATELSDPNLDFRVARDGEEYCMAHLPKAPTPTR